MHKWFAAIAAALLLAVSPVAAQDNTTGEILSVVDRFLEGINTQDPSLLEATTTDEGFVSAVLYRNGQQSFRMWPFSEDRERLAQGSDDTLLEKYWDPTILIHRGVAVVWAPYSFDVNGERSHCGIDVFNLALIEQEWKIVSIQFTYEDEGCPSDR